MAVKTKYIKRLFQCAISSLLFLFTSCTTQEQIEQLYQKSGLNPQTTFEKYLLQAQDGDPKIQNMIGYMLYYGEGVQQDYDKAHDWFHEAAENGDIRAQRNLGLFHAKVSAKIPPKYYNPMESNEWLTRADKAGLDNLKQEQGSDYKTPETYFRKGSKFDIGQKVYLTFCAGCHGFNGIAAYKAAPSFVSGDRLHKTDQQLLKSINNGRGLMPAWRDILTPDLQSDVLHYIRKGIKGNKKGIHLNFPSIESMNIVDINETGAKTYAMFCAGCHGFNGIAYYINSPSFALGQKMEKTDASLFHTIFNGHSMMPGWGDKLTREQIESLIVYIRTLEPSFNVGIERELNQPKGLFFSFPRPSVW